MLLIAIVLSTNEIMNRDTMSAILKTREYRPTVSGNDEREVIF